MTAFVNERHIEDFRPYDKYEPLFGSWYYSRFIGEGGCGRVYEIERREWDKTFRSALKIITIPRDNSEIQQLRIGGMDEQSIAAYYNEGAQRFAEEYAIMAEFRGNSNIVSYEDHQIIPHEDGIGYDILIRMELLVPLMEYAYYTPLTEMDVIRLGHSVCDALALCHDQGILHRDVKPDNIFVSSAGSFKLGDFGVARIIDSTWNNLSRTGTFTYMAPEVYRGESYGTQADLYSLGIVLYYLTNANRAPFFPPWPEPLSYDSGERALFRRMQGEPLPPPALASDALSAVIAKACAPEPGDRFGSAAEMGAALRAIENNDIDYQALAGLRQQTEPVREPIEKPSEKPVRKNNSRRISVLIILLVVMLFAGFVLFKGDFYPEKDPVATTKQNNETAYKLLQKYIEGETFYLDSEIHSSQDDYLTFNGDGTYEFVGFSSHVDSSETEGYNQSGDYEIHSYEPADATSSDAENSLQVMIELSPADTSSPLRELTGDNPVLKDVIASIKHGRITIQGTPFITVRPGDHFEISPGPYEGEYLSDDELSLFE